MMLQNKKRDFAVPLLHNSFRDLVEAEVYFHVELHRYRLAIFHGRLELPLPHGLNRLLVQAHTQSAGHAHVARMTIWSDNQPNDADALILRFASLFRVLRIGLVENSRRGNAAANVKDAATKSATGAWTNTGSNA